MWATQAGRRCDSMTLRFKRAVVATEPPAGVAPIGERLDLESVWGEARC